MSDVKWLRPTPPSELPGEYIIRGEDGDIVYWGVSKNLYHIWCEKVQLNPKNQIFEYKLLGSAKHSTCQMSD